LADIIVKLGGKLINDPMELENKANFPVIVPPDNVTLDVVCKILAESEANAIRIYSELAKKTKDSDPVIYRLISEILSEECSHEEDFENLTK
jgi:ferritin-like protein